MGAVRRIAELSKVKMTLRWTVRPGVSRDDGTGRTGHRPEAGLQPFSALRDYWPMLKGDAAEGARRGHRTVPHTADLRVEAWAATREECLGEAVRGLVDSFADIAGTPPRRCAERHLGAGSDEDLLVALVEEVIYRLPGPRAAAVAVRR